jgi:prevent-host-death family protein
MDKTLTATHFKAHCLALLDEVAETGESLLITKHGQPVARVDPVQPPASLRGSVTFAVTDDDLIAPLPEPWDAS